MAAASDMEKEQIFAMAEKEMEYRVEMFNKLTHTCFNKCVENKYKDSELNMGENSCIDKCVSKYWQVTNLSTRILDKSSSLSDESVVASGVAPVATLPCGQLPATVTTSDSNVAPVADPPVDLSIDPEPDSAPVIAPAASIVAPPDDSTNNGAAPITNAAAATSVADLQCISTFYGLESAFGPANKMKQTFDALSTKVFTNEKSDEPNLHCHFTCDEALLVPLVERDQLVPCEIAQFPFTEILCVESKKLLAAPTLPSEMQLDLEDREPEEVQVFDEMLNSCCSTVFQKAQSAASIEMIAEEATCAESSKAQLFAKSPRRDMLVRYVTAPPLDHDQRKIEFETFEDMYLTKFLLEPANIGDICLDKLFMENEDAIPRSDMFSNEMLSDDEHGESTGGFNDHPHSFLYSFDGAPTHLEEQSIITQLRNFRSGIICCHCEIAYLIAVMHWLLMELIHYEEDITRYSPVYKILMMLSCWVGVPNSKVLKLYQPSKVLALFADKEGWKSKAPAHLLKLDKGLHCLNLMEESKLEHDNAHYVLIVYMFGRSSQLVHPGNYIYEAAAFVDMDLLVVGVNMKSFRGLAKVGFQTIIYSLQHYSSSKAYLVVYLKFASLPFDPATLWGDWVYSEGKSTSCVVFTVAMFKDAGLVGQVVASQCFDLYPYDLGIQVLLPNSYSHVCRTEVVDNVLLGGVCTYYSVKLVPRPKELSAAAANIVEAPEDAGWMTSDHRYINKRVQYSFNHFIPSVRWRDHFPRL
ncbi:mitochondrial import inner membrane translocase subunit tim10 [Nicotiana attenuata]|uniref:Mitochondrial import inner membrane translocase subunit tim10 n=1 Tax=Nicotiana attenuata TaxID=49451 RepID=A0A1J6KUT4_NICAT|nr:mitochondrial import inner membrane translocase subunit tim10 [Nicotiana attenuata]